ncbi:MAG: NADH-quinone oxidoreductase subunit C [Candidatus Thermoplasmatota archaeon]|nr:NADH-quinone oxidoreductase subunit C [Candidatus Thermoplasmatota archaeon]
MNEIELPMGLDEFGAYFKERLGEQILNFKKEKIEKGVDKNEIKFIWMTVEKEAFREAVRAIAEIQIPHLSVASGSDKGEFVELIYHFEVNFSYPGEETTINLKVHLSKDDLTIPTITDIIPGALTTEREKQEFLGIDVIDIPDDRRLWLDENYPEDRYPWRWDEKGMEDMSRHIHENEETLEEPVAERSKKEGGD